MQGLTVSGKNGANGPTATPLARVPENSATEPARLPCLEATTALATQLRRLHALMLDAAQALCRASEPRNPFAKTPPVQVDFVTFWIYRLTPRNNHIKSTNLPTPFLTV